MRKESLPTQDESETFFGPSLSPKEYTEELGKRAVWAANTVLYEAKISDVKRNTIRSILRENIGEVDLPLNVVKALKEANLIWPTGLTIDQINDKGWRDLFERNDDETFRAFGYRVDLATEEGIPTGPITHLEINAGFTAEGNCDFNRWILKRRPLSE